MNAELTITPIDKLLSQSEQCRKGHDAPHSKLLFVPLEGGFDVMFSSANKTSITFLPVDDPTNALLNCPLFCISGYHFSALRHAQKAQKITPNPKATRFCLYLSDNNDVSALVIQDNKPRVEVVTFPVDEKLLNIYQELKCNATSDYDKNTADALAHAFCALNNRTSSVDEVTFKSENGILHITYRIGDYTDSFEHPVSKGQANLPDLQLSKSSIKAITACQSNGNSPFIEQHGNDVLLVFQDELRALHQPLGSLKIEMLPTNDQLGTLLFVDRFFLSWRLRDIKQHKEQLCDKYGYLHLTAGAIILIAQNQYIRTSERLNFISESAQLTGTLRFEVADIEDLKAGLNKGGADNSSMGINILENGDGSCTLEIFEFVGKEQRIVHMSCRCIWDDEAFERLQDTATSWEHSDESVPLIGEQQDLF
ncbi:hypothetical protein [Enterovibrio norvegicus]|uniref:hypothetical protein n=1 Tax=Enterovibrio norvegicus TaxID=188144 RepID=UPI0024B1FF7A|nr:hypothetical protein [Enterovibrio norvegicus]